MVVEIGGGHIRAEGSNIGGGCGGRSPQKNP